MFEVHDLIVRPVKVVRDERYLLGQLIEGVAEDSPKRGASSVPTRPPFKGFSQCGQIS